MAFLKFLIPILILFNNNLLSQETSAKDLAERIVNSLRNKDVNEFEELIISYEDYKRYILPGYKYSKNKIPEELIQEGTNFYEKKNNVILLKKIFSDILKNGKTIGIDNWSKVRLKSFKSKSITSTQASVTEGNYILGDIVVLYKKVDFCIYNVTMRKIGNQYKLNLLYGISKCTITTP